MLLETNGVTSIKNILIVEVVSLNREEKRARKELGFLSNT